MRLIGTLNTESDARRFSDYLLTAKMPANLEQESGGAWQVWIEHDDHVDAATNELHAYQANPNDPKYAAVHRAARKLREKAEREAERRAALHTDVRTSWARSATGQYATPVSAFLIGVSLVVALATQFGRPEAPGAIAAMNALIFQPREEFSAFAAILRGEVWRLVTPIFLHFDVLHILFNAMFTWRFGLTIESRKGSLRFVLLVLIAAVLSNSAEAIWQILRSDQPAPFGGLSGVNYALFGYAWFKGRFAPYDRIGVTPYDVGAMLTWLVLCMLGTFVSVMSIANAAHLGGLIVGCAIASVGPGMKRLRR